MKKILFDLSYSQEGKFFSGLYEYGKRIFKELNNEADITITLLNDSVVDPWIKTNAKKIVYLKNKKFSKAYFKELSDISNEYDIFYLPYQLTRGVIKTQAKLIFTIHDLCELELAKLGKINRYEALFLDGIKGKIKYVIKQLGRFFKLFYFSRKNPLKQNIKNAYRIITISNYSKSQIVRYFPFVGEEKISICYSPIKILQNDKLSPITYQDYNLMVSASRYTKNTYRAIMALDNLYKNGYTRKTIIVGALPLGVKKRINYPVNYVLLGYVDNETLEALYKNASLFIFPSLAEGFGSPPLEAMKYGTKTITSTAMSLKEIYQGTIQFNPYDIKEIEQAIIKGDSLTSEEMLAIFQKISQTQDEALIKIKSIIKDEENENSN